MPLVEDRETTALWIKGGEHFDELDEVDRRRLIFFEWRAISGWSHYYHMRQKGLIDDHQWSELVFLFERIGGRQAMEAAWMETREAYSSGFRAFMDGYFGPPP